MPYDLAVVSPNKANAGLKTLASEPEGHAEPSRRPPTERLGCVACHKVWPLNRPNHRTVKPTGPQGFEMLKMLLKFQRDPLTTLALLTQTYGDIVCYRHGPFPVVLLNHPEAVHHVLVENHPNYGKRHSPFYRMLSYFLGNGLVTSDGDFWLRQRRLAQPAFQRKRIEALSPIIVRCTEEMVSQWRCRPAGQPLDAAEEMMHLTLRVAGLLLFSQDLSQNRHAVGRALDEVQSQMHGRFSSLLPLPPILPTPRDKRFRQAKEKLFTLALSIVEERRRTASPPADLLTSLMEARDPETGESMNDAQICDELVTFMLAGHETTAFTLTWALSLLSLHPGIRRSLEAEVDVGNPVLPRSLCDRIVLEALRLYPAAWIFGRCSHGPDEFRGFRIGANQNVTVSPYILHRNKEFWPNPEGFDPDRFLQDIPRGAFVPFAAGPRQ